MQIKKTIQGIISNPLRRIGVVFPKTLFGILLLALSVVVGACSDSKEVTGPTDVPERLPAVNNLEFVGLRLDIAEFQEKGRFGLGLLATDKNDKAILSTNVTVNVKFDDSGFATTTSQAKAFKVVPESEKPVAAAILLDNSGSMNDSDPTKERGAAAEVFWEALLPDNDKNVVGLFDFVGCGAFRTLQSFTSDVTLLEKGVGFITASGGTPLYAATESTLKALDVAYDSVDNERVLLVLTDGQPTCYGNENSAVSLASDYGIPIYTVGLGPASDLSSTKDLTAVSLARNLAQRTQGVYAAASDVTALKPIFESIGRVSSRGQLIAFFDIKPVPVGGTIVAGVATFISGGQQREVTFSFVAPGSSPVSPSLRFEGSDF